MKRGSIRIKRFGIILCVPGGAVYYQQQDEEVVLLLRAHPITNVGWILLVIIMLLAPGILASLGLFAAVPGKVCDYWGN